MSTYQLVCPKYEEGQTLIRTKQILKFNGWIPEIVEDSNPKLPFYAP